MSEPSGKRLVIAIYYHPEAYPPTLNAIRELSGLFSEITVIYRPHLNGNWNYPSNVRTIASGEPISARAQEQSSTFQKILFFYRFVKDLLSACKKQEPDVILAYDSIPLLAYRLIRPLLGKKHKFWYHNHDIAEIDRLRKYSIGWFAARAEQKIFRSIDLFTLPSESRKKFFPLDKFKGSCEVVANYPARFVYESFYHPKRLGEELKLIFQGRIGEGHGFETIIPILNEKIEGKQLKLVLKGHCDESYKQTLLSIAAKYGSEKHVSFEGFGPYSEVPLIASQCHIGIGIFTAKEIMHLTLGTSSNKLYEYAAVGLPVLYTNEEHFSVYLSKYEWAFPVDDEAASIRRAIAGIVANYEKLSAAAHHSFVTELNFEEQFKPVIRWHEKQ